jgi:hypothetical protein
MNISDGLHPPRIDFDAPFRTKLRQHWLPRSCVRQVLQIGHGLGGRRFAVAAERRRSRSAAATAKLRG